MKRETIFIHGKRCYADSLKSKELSLGGTVIWYADNVTGADDWDRNAPARILQYVLSAPNDEVRR